MRTSSLPVGLRLIGLLLFMSGIVFCCSDNKPLLLLEEIDPQRSGITFSNQLTEDERLNIITFEYFYNGAGVGIGDVNNDGFSDIFFTANLESSRLYLNEGNFKFQDITERAGIQTKGKWATGVSMVDINDDGWLDIYICYAGPYADEERRANELYINNKDNTFTELAGQYGLADTGHSVQAAFFDYDRDGDLDAYLLTNITGNPGPNVIRHKRKNGEMINTDRLYRNNGNSTFTNVSREAGILIEGYGLGVSVADVNGDSWDDIYVSNDYLSNDLLYINNRDGTFTDHAGDYFRHTSYSAMGNDIADFNNDGLPDVVSVDMLPPDNKRQKLMFGATNYDRYRSEITYGYAPQFIRNTLQLNGGFRNDSAVIFNEIGQLAGIEATDWSWSALFIDFDNDGWKDLTITNGYPKDITNRDFASYKANEFIRTGANHSAMEKLTTALATLEGAYLPNFVFKNNGDLTFSDSSAVWGFTKPCYSTGAAYADLDNDGDLDVVINNTDAPALVYRNNAEQLKQNNFLKILFEGPPGNRQGLGVKVWAYTASGMQYFQHSPYRGFQSTVELGIHVGMGRISAADSIVIKWPDGKVQKLKSVTSNQVLKIMYKDAGNFSVSPLKTQQPLFQLQDGQLMSFVHKESHYVDFKLQPLLPQKYSQQGPGIAVGDLNGDGLDDVFVGGAFNQSGQLFIQEKTGKFRSKPLTNQIKYEEDLGVLLFDADQDGDSDLYVVSGGNEFQSGSRYYQDRLYFNDGRGNFKLQLNALPPLESSGSCVNAADYDRDGDLDLFVGGRLTPQHYPQPGKNCILQNNNGRFTDVTDHVARGLKNAGMVTAALWTDIDNDNDADLMLVGEWMPVTIFKNESGIFTKVTDAVPGSSGWWNSIAAADFDEDGDIDYILGNLGFNSRYKTSPKEPVNIYVNDLNGDGTQDPIITQYIKGVNYPVPPRDDLLLQVNSLKKNYPDYLSYSLTKAEDFFGDDRGSPFGQCQTFASSYLENRGNGEWRIRPLPIEAQFAPVYGIVTGDFTGDGHEDIILSGNSYAPDVLTGRYDALSGLLLMGDGRGNFKYSTYPESGILIEGDGKGLATMVLDNTIMLLAAQNDGPLLVFKNDGQSGNFMKVSSRDRYAEITHEDGRISKHEFYFGSGYLSQSTRQVKLPPNSKQIVVIDFEGKSRIVFP